MGFFEGAEVIEAQADSNKRAKPVVRRCVAQRVRRAGGWRWPQSDRLLRIQQHAVTGLFA